MSPTAVALILLAAIAHASWNLFSKQASATGAAYFVWLLAACATIGYLPVAVVTVLLTHPHLTGANWLFLGGTGALHSGYFLFLQLGYRRGELSVAYPIGRGSGALLAAVAGIVLLGERPTLVAAAGIIAIIGGVVAIGMTRAPDNGVGTFPLARGQQSAHAVGPERASAAVVLAAPGQDAGARTPRARALGFALATGAFIACYTIWDKYAVANLHTQPILQGLAGFPVMAAVFAPFAFGNRQRLAEVWRTYRRQVLGAALLAPLAYILILFALSFTAVSAVAPAREVSVLFGVLLGRRLLGEGHLARRLIAAMAIVAGIIAIAVG